MHQLPDNHKTIFSSKNISFPYVHFIAETPESRAYDGLGSLSIRKTSYAYVWNVPWVPGN